MFYKLFCASLMFYDESFEERPSRRTIKDGVKFRTYNKELENTLSRTYNFQPDFEFFLTFRLMLVELPKLHLLEVRCFLISPIICFRRSITNKEYIKNSDRQLLDSSSHFGPLSYSIPF